MAASLRLDTCVRKLNGVWPVIQTPFHGFTHTVRTCFPAVARNGALRDGSGGGSFLPRICH